MARRVIDCTGDADVAHFAGAEYRVTPKAEALGMTTILNTAGVDKKQFLEYVKEKPATYADWSGTWDQVKSHKLTSILYAFVVLHTLKFIKRLFIFSRKQTTERKMT